MEERPKGIFLLILLLPLLLIYVYFFNNNKPQTKNNDSTTVVSETKSEFDQQKFKDALNLVDYQVSQVTKSYKYGSTIKSKPQVTASKKIYLNNGLLVAATLNIDNQVLVAYPSDNERVYIFAKDKTYYTTNEDQYGASLLSIEEENPILIAFKDLRSRSDTKQVSKGVFEYMDYIKPTSEATQEQKNSPDYKTVYGQKMIFRYEFDVKTNLFKKYSILSNDRKYLIGQVTYEYKEVSQDAINSVSRIPDGYTKVEE